jgi:hypothetical protein
LLEQDLAKASQQKPAEENAQVQVLQKQIEMLQN